ncbi:MAG: hypothetical protein IJO62_05240 [Clostridia bacterium]|nr:hypothetical protein [Clostridia bacterium]
MNDIFNKYLTVLKKPKIIMLIGILGIVLIFLSSLSSKNDEQSKAKPEGEITAEEYKAILEKDIKKTVQDISGSKNISVVVTLESGIKYSYADTKEETLTEKEEKENRISDSDVKKGYITVKTSDGGEEALLVTVEMPEVRGVAIVCDGGDNEYIAEKIQNAVTAALDITSKRVYICGRNR